VAVTVAMVTVVIVVFVVFIIIGRQNSEHLSSERQGHLR
jgi:hypothetical protein